MGRQSPLFSKKPGSDTYSSGFHIDFQPLTGPTRSFSGRRPRFGQPRRGDAKARFPFDRKVRTVPGRFRAAGEAVPETTGCCRALELAAYRLAGEIGSEDSPAGSQSSLPAARRTGRNDEFRLVSGPFDDSPSRAAIAALRRRAERTELIRDADSGSVSRCF